MGGWEGGWALLPPLPTPPSTSSLHESGYARVSEFNGKRFQDKFRSRGQGHPSHPPSLLACPVGNDVVSGTLCVCLSVWLCVYEGVSVSPDSTLHYLTPTYPSRCNV